VIDAERIEEYIAVGGYNAGTDAESHRTGGGDCNQGLAQHGLGPFQRIAPRPS
jgi:hypothetical protein